MIYTTLNKIKSKYPCEAGWETLLKHLNKTEPDDEPLSFKTILESNGILNAIWALRTIEGHDKEIRLFAVACARRVQHLMTDKRSINALDVAEKYANGECTKAELYAAQKAALYAANAAWKAAWNAAGSAQKVALYAARNARAAARNAAWDAARAALDAARAAAGDARDAAGDLEVQWQTEEFKRVFCSE